MAKSRRVTVTPNMEAAVKHLKKVLKDLPEGDEKEKAKGAVKYLENTMIKGEKQPSLGRGCPSIIWFLPQ